MTDAFEGIGKFILPENIEEEAIFTQISLFRRSNFREKLYILLSILSLGILPLFVKWYPHLKIRFCFDRSKSEEADLIVVFGQDLSEEYIQTGERKMYYDGEFRNSKVAIFEYRFYTYFLDYKTKHFKPIQFLLKNKTNADILNEMALGIQGKEELEKRISTFGYNTTDVPIKSDFDIIIDEILSPFYLFQIFSCILWGFFEYYYLYASVIFIISVGTVIISFTSIKNNYKKLYKQAHLDIPIIVHRNLASNSNILGPATPISSVNLVPGDVFEVPEFEMMPCDAILIQGTAIMNESMLTGESIPVIKQSLVNKNKIFEFRNEGKHILYSGTKCLEAKKTKDKSPALAIAINTGFATEKGRLVRTLVFPKPELFKFYQDSVKFVAVMALFAIGLFIFTIFDMIAFDDSIGDIILAGLDVITIAVPPALATCMSIGTEIASERLESQQILTKSQNKIIVAGRVDMMCFDKTGTLTEENLDLHGVRCVNPTENNFSSIISQSYYRNLNMFFKNQNTKNVNHKLLEAMISCHTLTNLRRSVYGDPLDMKMFEAVCWTLHDAPEKHECVLKPPQEKVPGYYNQNLKIEVIKRFDFEPKLQRMSVIVQDPNESTSRVYVKGSPEMIRELSSSQIPTNFDDVLFQYTQRGLRVIACATKLLDKKINQSGELSRDTYEKNLEFIGFMIFENKLKEATPIGIAKLRHAKIPSIMITGDNPLTAICVARDCGMVSVGQKVVLAELLKSSAENVEIKEVTYRYLKLYGNFDNVNREKTNSFDMKNFQIELSDFPARTDKFKLIDSAQQDFSLDDEGETAMIDLDPIESIQSSEVAVAITGEAFNHLRETRHDDAFFKSLLSKTKVFARMKPEDKATVIEVLQNKGYIVGMCGDGANDCPALKQANVGISLSEAEASIAAPFLSKIPDICTVDVVLREGRAGLVTSFQCFKYMALYSVIQSITVVLLFIDTSSITDQACLYIDLAIILPLAFTMSLTEANEILSSRQPVSRLISVPVLASIIGQIIIQWSLQILIRIILQSQAWYVPPSLLNPANGHFFMDYDISYDSTTLFLFSNFQYLACVLAFSIGKPFRKNFYTNKGFTITLVLLFVTSSWLIFNQNPSIANFFGLMLFPESSFSNTIFLLALGNCFLTLVYERGVVPIFVKKWSKSPQKRF